MSEDNELDPLARLRAADPAAGVELSDGFVADVVARAAADGSTDAAAAATSTASTSTAATTAASTGTAATGAGAPGTAAPVTDLAAARSRRGRRLWLPIVAVAASVAVFGGAGFAIGTATSASTVAGGAAPAISLNGSGSSGSGSGTGSGGNAPAPASGPESGSSASSARAFDQIARFGFGRYSFTSSGLSTASGTAKAYALDARSASNAKTVGALAAAFGLAGTPELKDGAWMLGPQDGSAPLLSVSLDGALSFYYSNPDRVPKCSYSDTGEQTCEPAPAVGPPAEPEAIATMKALITQAGRDAGAFEYTTDQQQGSATRTVQAWPVVDGQRVDQAWTVELSGAGPVTASGSLAPIVSAGEYPVVSEKEAFARLSDPRFGAIQTAIPLAARAADSAASGATEATTPGVPAAPTEPPAIPAAGSPLSWAVTPVHIVGARLGLASQWQPDGSVLVVPAYEFTDADGGTWSVIAVADAKLDFSAE